MSYIDIGLPPIRPLTARYYSLLIFRTLSMRWIGEGVMLKWGLVFFLLAVASSLAGIVAGQNVAISVLTQILFFGNVVLFVVFTMLGAIDGRARGGRLKAYERIPR